MSRYIFKCSSVNAVQWFKHGDHPFVETYIFSANEDFICDHICGKHFNAHGQIDDLVVCPGDWILELCDKKYVSLRPEVFELLFKFQILPTAKEYFDSTIEGSEDYSNEELSKVCKK